MRSRESAIAGWLVDTSAVLCAAAFLCLSTRLPLHAEERVTLKNGFQLTCDHEQVIGSRIRLYTTPGDGDYLEIAAAEVQDTVDLPDSPQSAEVAGPAPENAKLTEVELGEMMARAGAQHDLDVDLLASVVDAESGDNPRAVSRAGAEGLMQLMPATAARLGVKDSFGPEQNINGGTAYLDALLTRFHENLALALAAYNAGPAAVEQYHGVPPYPETERYVARVIREFNHRKEAEMASRRNLDSPQ